MHTFVIEPYIGALPLRFGMSPKQVEAFLGQPDEVFHSFTGNLGERRLNVNLSYHDDRQLVEAVFAPGTEVLFENQDLFKEPDSIEFLRGFDQPYKAVGFIFFPELGIRLSGFLPNDEEAKAISVIRKGQWDEFRDSFVPYKSRLK
jgi:hypothetical protein